MDLKKTVLTILVLALFIAPLGICNKIKTSGAVLTVGNGGFSTIQEAIDASSNGDIIAVHNGTYNEHIVVDKSVTIIGENWDYTIIDAGGVGHAVVITANHVNISDFTIRNSGPEGWDAAIKISANYSWISHNKLFNNTDGISLIPSSHSIIEGNVIVGGLAGIDVYGLGIDAVDNKIVDNRLFNITYAIWIGFAYNCEILANSFVDNKYAIIMEDSQDNFFSNNYFKNNYLNARFANNSNNIWKNNYWDRPRLLPYIILGSREGRFFKIPMFNIDWRPALKPYKIY